MKKIFLKLLIATFVISALLGICVVITQTFNETLGKIFLSSVTLFGLSIPGLICSFKFEKAKTIYISLIGLIACFICAIVLLLLIWNIIDISVFDDITWKIVFTCLVVPIFFGHICLLLLLNTKKEYEKVIKYLTIVLASILCALILFSIYFDFINIGWQIYVILIILVALGTIVAPLVNRLNATPSKEQKEVSEDKYEKLDKIKKLLDSNAITKEEYEIEKNKILNS